MYTPLWHPLKNLYVDGIIKYNKKNEAIEIKYRDGYIIKEESYIDDILLESKIIKEKRNAWAF